MLSKIIAQLFLEALAAVLLFHFMFPTLAIALGGYFREFIHSIALRRQNMFLDLFL
jgi:hypothetical protein